MGVDRILVKTLDSRSNPGWITYTLECPKCGRDIDVNTNRGPKAAVEENQCKRGHEGDIPSPPVPAKKEPKKEPKDDNKRTLRNKAPKRRGRKKG